LTLWYSVVTVLGLSLFAISMWVVLQHRLAADLDERLRDQAHGLQAVIDGVKPGSDESISEEISEFARELPEHGILQLQDDKGQLIFSEPVEMAPVSLTTLSGYQTVYTDRGQLRVFNLIIPHGGKLYGATLGASTEVADAIMHSFRNLLFLVIPGVVAFSTLGGYWMSRRALGPVDEITRVAKSITVYNLSRRLVVPDSCDELQRISEAWNDVLHRLDTAVQRIGQFTADASHELRSPIALIRATSELALKSERTPTQYRDSMRVIESEAIRMTELTESLLTLARMDSNNVEMPVGRVDLNRIIEDLIDDLRGVADTRGVALTVDPPIKGCAVLANEAGIRRLLLILLDNGIKYTPAGGAVVISVATETGKIWITIRDSGIGIAPEHLPHIFERFYRADTSRTGNEGAGLGLSIAQMIAELHGTKIEVASQLNVGSSFRFCLNEFSTEPFSRFSDSSGNVESMEIVKGRKGQ
jgi:heavy metal sensor kinase